MNNTLPAVYYAHSCEDRPATDWHLLDEHLIAVSRLASNFANGFGAAEWAEFAGLWHDLGKYQPEFQRRLRGENIGVPHAWIGAVKALQADLHTGHLIAFPVLGHHGGIPDRANLRELVKSDNFVFPPDLDLPKSIMDHKLPTLPKPLVPTSKMSRADTESLSRKTEFWMRFVFSALVDADFLDTEAFFDTRASASRGSYRLISDLRENLDAYIEDLSSGLPSESRALPVNRARAKILLACRDAAQFRPGMFSLTVPTGGGKTLSAMSFALHHAEKHALERVIVVIPYTSIIEQNADVYRRAMGDSNVIEHHSNLDPNTSQNDDETSYRHRLAAENWDAPIIVTTTVQFFESLFSNKPSRCRKLHNIANSVIVLDEVQTLPPGFLYPICEALNELVEDYGCTVVLSTATPPALRGRNNLPTGLKNVREIIDNPAELGKNLERVKYSWPRGSDPLAWPDLGGEIAKHKQILSIVHRRADARILAEEASKQVSDESVFHLSALMCPAHRREVIREVTRRLRENEPCRLVSTQLVEAGVDLDFPIVYRALGGLDSMVQAAGRCNREGKRNIGKVKIFRAPTPPPQGVLTAATEVTWNMLIERDNTLDITDPTIFEEYFRRLYFTRNLDSKNIQRERAQFNFETVASLFRLIEDDFTSTVIIPYNDAAVSALNDVRLNGISRDRMRKLQLFTVSIYPNMVSKFRACGALEQIFDDCSHIFTLTKPYRHLYDDRYGLSIGDDIHADPKALIV